MGLNRLETERLRLRPLRDGDLARLVELDSDPEVMRHLTNGVPNPPDHVAVGFARMREWNARFDDRLGFWMAELRDSGEWIGWFHLRPGKRDRDNVLDLELGYRLRRAHWGQGYATEMSRELVRYAFEEQGARSVFAETMRRNRGSRGVMEKAGLIFECEFLDPEFTGDEIDVRYRIRAPGPR